MSRATSSRAISELINIAHKEDRVGHEFMSTVSRMLQPFAPHLAEELWQRNSGTGFVFSAPWPKYDPALCEGSFSEVIVQVGGKRRGSVRVPFGCPAAEVEMMARQHINSIPAADQVRKMHYVPDRVLNLVV